MIIDTKGNYGIDLSKYQSDPIKKLRFNFSKARENGIKFVIPKIGQYNYYDYDAEYNWLAARDAGLNRGSYWFFDYRATGKYQAQKHFDFLDKRKDLGEGVHFVDFETGSGSNNWQGIYDFIVEFQRLSGLPNHKIGVYTGYFFWIENSPASIVKREWFAQYPLWLAWYIKGAPITNAKDVYDYYANHGSLARVPANWKDVIDSNVIIWQAGTPSIGKQIGSQSAEIDFNLFNGDAKKFEKYFGVSVEPEPSPEPDDGGEDMYNLIVLTAYLNGRATAGSAGQLIFPAGAGLSTGFQKDDVLVADAKQTVDGTDWYCITKCTRNGQDVLLPHDASGHSIPVWASAGATYLLMRLYTPAPTPTDEPAETLYVSLEQGGKQYKYTLVKE